MTPTKEQLKAGMSMIVAVTESIREAGEIAEGTLYGVLVGRIELPAFEKMIAMIVNTGLVEKRGHLLLWRGPKFAA